MQYESLLTPFKFDYFLAGKEVGGWIQYAIREAMRYGSHAIREVLLYCHHVAGTCTKCFQLDKSTPWTRSTVKAEGSPSSLQAQGTSTAQRWALASPHSDGLLPLLSPTQT